MLKISCEEIDRAYISEWAERLDLSVIWKAILARLSQNNPLEGTP